MSNKTKSQKDIEGMKASGKMDRINFEKMRLSGTGHVITRAKPVQSIRGYVNYASTIEHPYIVSTNSKYVSLIKSDVTERVMRSVSSQVNKNSDKLLDELVRRVKRVEEKNFNKLPQKIKDTSGASNTAELAKWLNVAAGEHNQVFKEMQELLLEYFEMVRNFMHKEFRKPETVRALAEDLITVGPSRTIKEGQIINYRIDDAKRVDALFQDLVGVLNQMNELDAISYGDFDSMEKAMTSMASLINKAQDTQGLKPGMAAETYNSLKGIYNGIVKEYGQFIQGGFQSKRITDIRGMGYFHEILTLLAFQSGLDYGVEVDSEKNRKVYDEFVRTQMVAGKDTRSYGTADLAITFNGEKTAMGIDAKFIGPKQVEQGVIYQGTLSVSYANTLDSFFHDASFPEPLRKFFRAYLANRAPYGYRLRPEMKKALTEYHMVSKADEMFKPNKEIEIGGESYKLSEYPLLLTVNLKNYPFSVVVQNFNNFTSTHEGKQTFSLTEGTEIPDHIEMYKRKIEIGQGKKIAGFSSQVNEVKAAASMTESMYNRESTRMRYRIFRK